MRALLYLGALLTATLLAIVLQWGFEHYRAHPHSAQVSGDPRLSFRPAAHLARRAVRRFRALPADEQHALRNELIASTSTLDAWANAHVGNASLICLGERHEDGIRAFIGDEILPRLDYQVLMLEASQAQLQDLVEKFNKGQTAMLLDASLNDILHAARTRSPPARIIAIDEHQGRTTTARTTADKSGDRETSLVERIRKEWRPGQRHTVLFGALHCRALSGWMLHQLRQDDIRIRLAGAIGTVVLARYREAGAQVLMYLLEEIGLEHKVVVIPQVSRFPKLIQQWLPPTADAFAGYDSAILFDDRSSGVR